jgi:hypothetical protein
VPYTPSRAWHPATPFWWRGRGGGARGFLCPGTVGLARRPPPARGPACPALIHSDLLFLPSAGSFTCTSSRALAAPSPAAAVTFGSPAGFRQLAATSVPTQLFFPSLCWRPDPHPLDPRSPPRLGATPSPRGHGP